MSNYLDLFIRDALGQLNTLPRQGGGTKSPDIISSGTTPADDPSSQYGEDSYDQDAGQDIVYGQANYIYVRGENYGSALSTGTVSLYAAYKEQLSTPSKWQQLSTEGGSTTAAAAADANEIAVTTDAFVWTPEQPTAGNPYLLIAVIATKNHPDPVPAYKKKPTNFTQWQAAQGGVSALSIAVPKPPTPPSSTYELSALVNLGNADPLQMSVSLSWQNAAIGDLVSLVSDTPGTSGPIGFENYGITLANQTTSTSGSVAANYSSVFHATYTAQNSANPPAPTLVLTVSTGPASSGGNQAAGGGPGHLELSPPHPVTLTEIASFQFTATLKS